MFTANTLSRAVDKKESADTQKNAEIQDYVDRIVASLPVSAERMEQMKRETATDQPMTSWKKQYWKDGLHRKTTVQVED